MNVCCDKAPLEDIRERFDSTFLTSKLQVITGKEGGGTYREGLCTYMDLLYKENSADGDDGIERGIILVGASSQSPLPHKPSTPKETVLSPSSLNQSISNDDKLSENNKTTDETKEGRPVVRSPEPRSDPLMEAIEKAKRLHDVSRVLVINLREDICEGDIIYENEGEYKERRGLGQESLPPKGNEKRCSEVVATITMSLTTAHNEVRYAKIRGIPVVTAIM
eukprot:CAMPEP_0119046776 /NCGR_PEP_ID=MMETSP1177-20130426/48906_1 /TAXON_ID=2985 /ORGANISM="Ochromonas sp, Strain CCMP1899" /LENGTH=221 /DNA_ID=CAMNT_0007020429 /DNA_START=404 /DNA_END=1070 /DNA_ORIENTATION=+